MHGGQQWSVPEVLQNSCHRDGYKTWQIRPRRKSRCHYFAYKCTGFWCCAICAQEGALHNTAINIYTHTHTSMLNFKRVREAMNCNDCKIRCAKLIFHAWRLEGTHNKINFLYILAKLKKKKNVFRPQVETFMCNAAWPSRFHATHFMCFGPTFGHRHLVTENRTGKDLLV